MSMTNRDRATAAEAALDTVEAVERESVADRLRREIAETEREQLYWVAVSALRHGLYELPQERRAGIDPLGMLHAAGDAETIAQALTGAELRAAHDAGEGDYWESANSEIHEAHDQTAGTIAGMKHALSWVEAGSEQATKDAAALDQLAEILKGSPWPSGADFLEATDAIVRTTGRIPETAA